MINNAASCCCRWGAARGGGSGEWPEFPCWDCPTHGQEPALSDPQHRCKRHAVIAGPVDMEALKDLLPLNPAEVDAAIASIRKDAS